MFFFVLHFKCVHVSYESKVLEFNSIVLQVISRPITQPFRIFNPQLSYQDREQYIYQSGDRSTKQMSSQ